jgi:thiamine kinase-like enzyme
MKKRSRFKIAYDRLLAVSRAVDSLSPSFQVASSRGIDEKHCLFFQDEMKGENISAILDGENCKDILYSVGAIHYDLHSLDTHEVPEWDFPTLLDNLEKAVKWIIFFEPEHSKFLDYILDLLMKHVPEENPREYTFCHGDFVCSQILKEGARFSITDFDLATRGDPYHELAILIASLKYDVPFFEKMIINLLPEVTSNLLEVINAYLAGYQERAQKTLDKKRLLWYRINAEIYYFALRLKKDRVYPNTVDNAVETIRNLSELFRQEKGR